MTTAPATLVDALIAFQRAMPTVTRNCTGQIQNRQYGYADLAQVVGAIRIPLADAGFAFTQILDNDTLLTKLLHVGGDELVSRMPLHLDGLTPQQIGSLLTYSRRYTLTALLGVAVGGEDDNAADAESAVKSAATSSAATLKDQLRKSIALEESHKADTPARVEHVRDPRFQRLTGEDGRPIDLFKRVNGSVYWARGRVQDRGEPAVRRPRCGA